MEVRAKAFVVALALVTGCSVGEYGTETTTTMTPDASMTTTTTGGNGEASFNSMVKPLVSSCTSCHAGNQAPNLTSFTTLAAKYKMKPGSTNILVTKGNHAGIQYLDATAKSTVQSWIDSL